MRGDRTWKRGVCSGWGGSCIARLNDARHSDQASRRGRERGGGGGRWKDGKEVGGWEGGGG